MLGFAPSRLSFRQLLAHGLYPTIARMALSWHEPHSPNRTSISKAGGPIGNRVLPEACRQARAWLDAGGPPGTMAVNISAMEFGDPHFPDGVFISTEKLY